MAVTENPDLTRGMVRKDRARCVRFLNYWRIPLGDAYRWLYEQLSYHNPTLVLTVAQCVLEQGAQDRGEEYWQAILDNQHAWISLDLVSDDGPAD